MDNFHFSRPTSLVEATAITPPPTGAFRFIAGGTTLVDLMKLGVETPSLLVDINTLPLDTIEQTSDGCLKIGALVRNSALAQHPTVLRNYAVLSQALLSGASPQLRNMATTGGNLMQRTRCIYFRDTVYACNKRNPGSGCSAIDGHNRTLAILGTSEHCIATNPSDMNVALTALDATVHVQNRGRARSIPIQNFFLLPGDTPHLEHPLESGDLITHVTLPPPIPGTQTVYLKLRDRASYEFALSSAAVVLGISDGKIHRAQLAMGGIATRPWRSSEAEHLLQGHAPSTALFRQAAETALHGAHPRSENGFKIELAKRCLVRALTLATKTA